MSLVDRVHGGYVFKRRIRRLSQLFAELIPPNCTVLDVGCGDGKLASSITQQRPDLRIEGVDVLVREHTWVPVQAFDGISLPYDDHSFEAVMFVDVLHHAPDPVVLLREAVRVTRRWLIIKEHLLKGMAAGARLRFMDYVGNSRFGVALPYNYWPEERWEETRRMLGMKTSSEIKSLGLYPWPAELIFGANLHFVSRFEV
ncbi:MAG TPA: class I SAM-dependent methyltransferase [Terriglobales bacterium]|nr:class I SAM-dependent methyltransferase [Terriglobales bacterium]